MKNIPVEFLLVCSNASLQEFELSRLNRMSNLRKNLHTIQDELRQVEVEALVARWLLEHRAELFSLGNVTAAQGELAFAGVLPAVEVECAPRPALPRRCISSLKKERLA